MIPDTDGCFCKRLTIEPISKRFSLVKVKAGKNFNRRNTLSILRIEIFAQRGDWPKWDVLKPALFFAKRTPLLRTFQKSPNPAAIYWPKLTPGTLKRKYK